MRRASSIYARGHFVKKFQVSQAVEKLEECPGELVCPGILHSELSRGMGISVIKFSQARFVSAHV